MSKPKTSRPPSLDDARDAETKALAHVEACRAALDTSSPDDAERLASAVVRAEAAHRGAVREREAAEAAAEVRRLDALRVELVACTHAADETAVLQRSAEFAREIRAIERETADRIGRIRSDWGQAVADQAAAHARAVAIADELGESPPQCKAVSQAWAMASAAIAICDHDLAPIEAERWAHELADTLAPGTLSRGSGLWEHLPHAGAREKLAALAAGPSAFGRAMSDLRARHDAIMAEYDRDAETARAAKNEALERQKAERDAHATLRFEALYGGRSIG